VNRNQFEISPETRHTKIINYIISHEGCTRADLVRGLEKDLSKKTVYKLAGLMIKEGILKHPEDRKNSKKSPLKLFVNKNNLLGSVNVELEQFYSSFISFFDRTNEKIIFPMFHNSSEIAADIILQLSEERLALFFRMVECIFIRSVTKWPKRIQDKKTLKKIYRDTFARISDMLIDIAENHEIPSFVLESNLEKLAMTKLRGGALFEFWKKFKDYGMQQEIERVIDAIWNLEKEIQKIAYRDLENISRDLGMEFKYGPDDLRKLFYALNSLDEKAR